MGRSSCGAWDRAKRPMTLLATHPNHMGQRGGLGKVAWYRVVSQCGRGSLLASMPIKAGTPRIAPAYQPVVVLGSAYLGSS